MSFTYGMGGNPQIDAPRMLIADTDSTHPIFQDEEILMAYNIDTIQYFPQISTNVASAGPTPSYRFVAALLLEALAANKARLAAALEVLDIKIDASKAAIELRKTAEAMRDAERNSGAYGIAELFYDQFTGRERLWKQLIRVTGGN
jgi:hypothetical protein